MPDKKKWEFATFEDPEAHEITKGQQMNRTLYVDKFSDDPSHENELVEIGNTTELFEKLPAKASVEVETLSGDVDDAELLYTGIPDFKRDAIILKLNALREQAETAALLEHFLKLFGTGGKWKRVFEDAETKAAFQRRLDWVLGLLEGE
ncbi:hypothetical protein ACFL6M_05075 [Candidatus Eisenbacteria bacterium]|uniref:Uncharacterized protein n=1 Tax=Eiseniibacteriota bacterium TaxID=2212470 RepID=A0ABV6YKV9_UNCEI